MEIPFFWYHIFKLQQLLKAKVYMIYYKFSLSVTDKWRSILTLVGSQKITRVICLFAIYSCWFIMSWSLDLAMNLTFHFVRTGELEQTINWMGSSSPRTVSLSVLSVFHLHGVSVYDSTVDTVNHLWNYIYLGGSYKMKKKIHAC
jgi:hypothetical protein